MKGFLAILKLLYAHFDVFLNRKDEEQSFKCIHYLPVEICAFQMQKYLWLKKWKLSNTSQAGFILPSGIVDFN